MTRVDCWAGLMVAPKVDPTVEGTVVRWAGPLEHCWAAPMAATTAELTVSKKAAQKAASMAVPMAGLLAF